MGDKNVFNLMIRCSKMDISKQVAIVSGSNRGLGKHLALEL
ncbi:hypothetical protein [Paenibacillus sp. S29]